MIARETRLRASRGHSLAIKRPRKNEEGEKRKLHRSRVRQGANMTPIGRAVKITLRSGLQNEEVMR